MGWLGTGTTCDGLKPVNRTLSNYEFRRFVTLCLTCTINRVNPFIKVFIKYVHAQLSIAKYIVAIRVADCIKLIQIVIVY
jgi:hypothetical protein